VVDIKCEATFPEGSLVLRAKMTEMTERGGGKLASCVSARRRSTSPRRQVAGAIHEFVNLHQSTPATCPFHSFRKAGTT
jgi:hypothetical protein